MKKCSTCKIEKDLSDFGKNKFKPDGFQHSCNECRRNFYKKRSAHYIDKTKKQKRKIRDWIIKHKKKSKCNTCPETDWICLDFHHMRDKDIAIGAVASYGWSIERIKKEIEKCIILCANCHRKLHRIGE